ncbi:MAG TPA: hypothetical protein VFK13_04575 [Gemmatimonadaceae bacterium]|nr:hypothetical protein [Gemmatimonadaceae bacterium]
MSAPVVQDLRARPGVIRLAPPDAQAMAIRVEVPERWDVVRIDALPSTTVLSVKVAALEALAPRADAALWVIKLRGYEVLDEERSLADVGATSGTTFLLTHRRRRPVR